MKLNADSRKVQIIDEAAWLFSRKGYDKVTTKELATACEISEPALYRYFPSKDAIYEAVLDSLPARADCSELFARLATEENLEKLLTDLAQQILEFLRRNEDVYRLLLYSTLREHTKARMVFQVIRGTYVDFLSQQLDRLQSANLIVSKNNEITAGCFVGMVFDCAMSDSLWHGFLGKKCKPAKAVANSIAIFARGLSRDRLSN